MRHMLKNQQAAGFSIVEVLVALLLGMLVSLAVVQLYITNTQTYQTNEEIARLQENSRYIMYRLRTALRMAGYMGCFKSDPTKLSSTSAVSSSIQTAFASPVSGTEGTGYNGSDDITLSYGEGDQVSTVSNITGTSTSPTYTATGVGNTAASGDLMLISDCEKAVLFSANTVTLNTIATSGMTATFQAGAEIMPAASVKFLIRSVGGIPTFAQQVNNGAIEDLVENVESMQILYGEDTDTTQDYIANSYRKANAVSDFNKIVSVRVILTLRTPQRGTNTDIIRQTMELTIDVRNR